MGDDETRARAALAEMQHRISAGPRATLGVGDSASPDEVRAAFLDLTKRYHPARFGRMSPEIQRLSNEVFLAIKSAHDTLLRGSRSGAMPVITDEGSAGVRTTRTMGTPPIGRQPAATRPPPRAAVPSSPATYRGAPITPAPSAAQGAPPTYRGAGIPPGQQHAPQPPAAPPAPPAHSPPGAGTYRGTPIAPAVGRAPTGRNATARPTGSSPAVSRTATPSRATPSSGMPALSRPGAAGPAGTAAPRAPTPSAGMPAIGRPGTPPPGAGPSTVVPARTSTGRPTTPSGSARRPSTPPTDTRATSARPHEPELDETAARQQALALLDARNWSAARQALQALAARVPQVRHYRALLCYARGREAHGAGRVDEAALEYQRALQLDAELGLAKQALMELQARRR